ncbi:MAG: Rieske 2Fe-2S domain-containing protein [Bradyrhizobium sp.]|uniref:Rieske 2Fe-2S domain-containing protein n=1 Tax=Bradyrhizobium sp. TaxID=376 RepID=UPI003D0DDF8A
MTTSSALRPYTGYYKDQSASPNLDLTRVGKGTPGGELLRRFWHPVMMSSMLGAVPHRFRALGEDLVMFRDLSGRLGCLHLHCSHRGASLEFGLVAQRGIVCCYHGWHFDIDGTIVSRPGEADPEGVCSTVNHGAYPVREHAGLIFIYMGPPEEQPPFWLPAPVAAENNELHPYYLPFPCNWLQSHENAMDPAHSVFLHTRVAGVQFSESFGILPSTAYRTTDRGVIATTARRVDDRVWIRVMEELTPTGAQFGPPWEDGSVQKLAAPPAITRWVTPIDDTHCATIGWRHFNKLVDPDGRGRPEDIGYGKVDFVGQTDERSYEERQIEPGDFDAQVSQRPIAVHALEHLGRTDIGVVMVRRNLLRKIEALKRGERINIVPGADSGFVGTFSHDTVVPMPRSGENESAVLERLREAVTDATVATLGQSDEARRAAILDRLRAAEQC